MESPKLTKFILFLGFTVIVSIILSGAVSAAGLANSSQPKFQHDNQNTGQSQYNGSQTNATKWKYSTGNSVDSSPIIGSNGTIYVGSSYDDYQAGLYHNVLYAVNPNGTRKWNYTTGSTPDDNGRAVSPYSSPAIGSDGTIYVGSGSYNNYMTYGVLAAINPNGTLKWKYTTPIGSYYQLDVSSPAIGDDGTIYFGCVDGNLYALNPNGTLKWNYTTTNNIDLSPAIGHDGTIYVGSSDFNLYAINPNGTLKWKYNTGDWILSSPAVGSDGTIYIGNSYDLLAVNPNGTQKWNYTTETYDKGIAIGNDGTIFIGSQYYDSNDVAHGILYALNPNGTLKWNYTTEYTIDSSLTIGADGTIYIGSNGLYAINPNGTLKWISNTGADPIDSSPAIDKDGTIYVGGDGDLYAVLDVTPPTITFDPKGGSYNTIQYFKLNAKDPDSTATAYYTTDGSDPRTSSTRIINTIPVAINKNITICFAAVDPYGNWSPVYNQTYTITGTGSNTGLANSPQPQVRHDQKNTGQSQYNGSATNSTKWISKADEPLISMGVQFTSAVIGSDGTIYVGGSPVGFDDGYLYAINPNGLFKWKYRIGNYADSSPAIGKDGTIYMIGGDENSDNFYAINPNGTLKWKYANVGGTSINIDNYGTIYITGSAYLYALNLDGTLYWKNDLGGGNPAIGSDGTIYMTSDKLYALSPNGMIKWKYDIGASLSPAIGADGTIYIGGEKFDDIANKYNGYLYAINPTGNLKWKYNIGQLDSSPAIASNGIIYITNAVGKLFAIYPNGTKKWSYSPGGILVGDPTIGANGIIYIENPAGGGGNGDLYAINPNGTLKWKFYYGGDEGTTPAIASDGTIYTTGFNTNYGRCLIAIGTKSSKGLPPTATANPLGGVYNTTRNVLLSATDPDPNDTIVTIYWTLDGTNPQTSSTRHSFGNAIFVPISKTTTLKYSAKDPEGNWSPIYTQFYIIDKTAPTATATPAIGTYSDTIKVTLAMSEKGTIYYTTNGTTPTTSSSKYTIPFYLSTSKTLKFFARDLAGNKSPVYTKTYTIHDITQPKVVSASPLNNSIGVPISQVIKITFSEPIQAGSTYANVILKDSSGTVIPITKSISGNVLTIKLASGTYTKGAKYIVTLPVNSLKDSVGNGLTTAYKLVFTVTTT